MLFCVASEADPAVPVIQALQRAHPHVVSRLFIGAASIGINPKINNICLNITYFCSMRSSSTDAAFHAARHEVVWICDASICSSDADMQLVANHSAMSNNICSDLLAALGADPCVGLAHQLPFTTTSIAHGAGNHLESV